MTKGGRPGRVANEKDSRARETEEEKFIFSTADTCCVVLGRATASGTFL